MCSCCWCKNRTYLCGPSNYPVSYETVYGRERKFAEIRVYLSPRYRFCTKPMLGVWRVQKCIPLVGAKTALTCEGLQSTVSHVRRYRADNGKLRKFGSTFCHGTVFAPKQCLYQKEATGMECPKMYSSRWYKNRTYLCGPANYPVSCEAV